MTYVVELFGLLPISKGETEGSFTAAMVGIVTQISKDGCIMDDGNGLKPIFPYKEMKTGI